LQGRSSVLPFYVKQFTFREADTLAGPKFEAQRSELAGHFKNMRQFIQFYLG
jgi:hypothetical protein